MQDLHNVQVVAVEPKANRDGSSRYVVKLSTGIEPSTFDGVLGATANQRLLQPSDVRLEQYVSKQGRTGWNLVAIAAPGGLPPMPLEAGTPLQNPQPAALPTTLPPPPLPTFVDEQAKQERISKMGAAKIAFNFISTVTAGCAAEGADLAPLIRSAWQLAEEIYLATGGKSASSPNAHEALPLASTPQEIQAQVEAVMGAGAISTGPNWGNS